MPADARIAVGVERFDYTKGILDRMRAVEAPLERRPEWRGKFVFIQAAAPTRSKLDPYRALQEEAQRLATAINARDGDGEDRRVVLSVRHHQPDEVYELFRAADICVVSSLHNGMNLVAKEFVAARDDEQGVLVLSSFAGASRELAEALIVNPYDARALRRARHGGRAGRRIADAARGAARPDGGDARTRAPAQRLPVGCADAARRCTSAPPSRRDARGGVSRSSAAASARSRNCRPLSRAHRPCAITTRSQSQLSTLARAAGAGARSRNVSRHSRGAPGLAATIPSSRAIGRRHHDQCRAR